MYEFTCLPNGLSEAPRKFTKLMKVVFSHLRERGHVNCFFFDDSFLLGETFENCVDNVKDTTELVDMLGFTVHPEKSVIFPTQVIIFLGFVLNSLLMIVSMTEEKSNSIKEACQNLTRKQECTIREFAAVIGMLVAAQPGVEDGAIYYRRLEIEKARCLKWHKGNFDAKITLSREAREDLDWWIHHSATNVKKLVHGDPTVRLRSDSSGRAWGGVYGTNRTGGPWSMQEAQRHINVKELHAAFLTLQTFGRGWRQRHVRIELDNATAVAYLNKKGGKKEELNNLARQIWLWANERELWISAAHLPGSQNTEADTESRKGYSAETEWQLNPVLFKVICDHFGKCDVDLFASRLNFQIAKYASWHPDPKAWVVDAFSVSWTNMYVYAFPPFSILGRVLNKIATDQTEAVVVAPLWSTQPWFTTLLRMSVDLPRILPQGPRTLILPQDPGKRHSLSHKLKLTVFRLSGRPSAAKEFRERQPTSFATLGAVPQRNSTSRTSKDICVFAVDGVQIRCLQV